MKKVWILLLAVLMVLACTFAAAEEETADVETEASFSIYEPEVKQWLYPSDLNDCVDFSEFESQNIDEQTSTGGVVYSGYFSVQSSSYGSLRLNWDFSACTGDVDEIVDVTLEKTDGSTQTLKVHIVATLVDDATTLPTQHITWVYKENAYYIQYNYSLDVTEAMTGIDVPGGDYKAISLDDPEIEVVYTMDENDGSVTLNGYLNAEESPRTSGTVTCTLWLGSTSDGYILIPLEIRYLTLEESNLPDHFYAADVHTVADEETTFAAPQAAYRTDTHEGTVKDYGLRVYSKDFYSYNGAGDNIEVPDYEYSLDNLYYDEDTFLKTLIFHQAGVYELEYKVELEEGVSYTCPVLIYVAESEGEEVVPAPILSCMNDGSEEGTSMDTHVLALPDLPGVVQDELWVKQFSLANYSAMRRLTGTSPVWSLERISGEDIGLRIEWNDNYNMEDDGTYYEQPYATVYGARFPTQEGEIVYRVTCSWGGETVSRDCTIYVEANGVTGISGIPSQIDMTAGEDYVMTIQVEGSYDSLNVYGYGVNNIYNYWDEEACTFTLKVYEWKVSELQGEAGTLHLYVQANGEAAFSYDIPVIVHPAEGDDPSGLVPQSDSYEDEEEICTLVTGRPYDKLYRTYKDWGAGTDAQYTFTVTSSNEAVATAQGTCTVKAVTEGYNTVTVCTSILPVGAGDAAVTATLTNTVTGSTDSWTYTVHVADVGRISVSFNGLTLSGRMDKVFSISMKDYLVSTKDIDLSGLEPEVWDDALDVSDPAVYDELYNDTLYLSLHYPHPGIHRVSVTDFWVRLTVDGTTYGNNAASDAVTLCFTQESGDMPALNIARPTVQLTEDGLKVTAYASGGSTGTYTVTYTVNDSYGHAQDTKTVTGNRSALLSVGRGGQLYVTASVTDGESTAESPEAEILVKYGTWDNITWQVDDETLTVGGSGAIPDISNAEEDGNDPPWNTVDGWSRLVLGDQVTVIPDCLFMDSALTEVQLGSGLQRISKAAFSGTSISEITLPEGLLSIDSCALADTMVTELTVPASVTFLSGNVFAGSGNIMAVYVAEGSNTYTDVDGVVYTKDMTELVLCPNRTAGSYEVPEGVTTIGDYAFRCSGVDSVTLPSSLRVIGSNAFSGCRMTEVTLPEGLETIGEEAFDGCEELATVVIPVTVKNIGAYAFHNWEDEIQLTVMYGGTEEDWDGIEIGEGAFNDGTIFIWVEVGVWDDTLPTLTIPAHIEELDAEAFAETELQSVIIPAGCTVIGPGTFANCPNLVQVRILCENANGIDETAFDKSVMLFVPAENTEAFETLRHMGYRVTAE